MSFRLLTLIEEFHAVVELAGEVNKDAVSQLEEKLEVLLGLTRRVIIEMSAVESLDCHAYDVLEQANKCFQAQGGSVRLVIPNNRVRQGFRIVGLDKSWFTGENNETAFYIHDDVDHAIRCIGG